MSDPPVKKLYCMWFEDNEAVIKMIIKGGSATMRLVCGMFCVLHRGAGLCSSGRSATPCGGCAGYSWVVRVGLPAVGTPSATRSIWVGVGQLHCWGAPAAAWSVGCLTSCTRVQVCLRYHAMGVLVIRGQSGLVCRRSGRLRWYHPSRSVYTRGVLDISRCEVLHLFAGSIRW